MPYSAPVSCYGESFAFLRLEGLAYLKCHGDLVSRLIRGIIVNVMACRGYSPTY